MRTEMIKYRQLTRIDCWSILCTLLMICSSCHTSGPHLEQKSWGNDQLEITTIRHYILECKKDVNFSSQYALFIDAAPTVEDSLVREFEGDRLRVLHGRDCEIGRDGSVVEKKTGRAGQLVAIADRAVGKNYIGNITMLGELRKEADAFCIISRYVSPGVESTFWLLLKQVNGEWTVLEMKLGSIR